MWLVRRICQECKMEYDPPINELEMIGLNVDTEIQFLKVKVVWPVAIQVSKAGLEFMNYC